MNHNLKFLESFKHEEKYEDKLKNEKSILTDFINENFLKTNDNELMLLRLMYTKIQPVLDKFGLLLIFKGGNVMRLINKNVLEYFQPLSTDIILDIFSPFLKQSDNDFAVIIDPNRPQYEQVLDVISWEIYRLLDEIRNEIEENVNDYFYLFNYSDAIINRAFKELSRKLGVGRVTMNPITDKIIVNSEPSKPLESNVLVYEDLTNSKHFIYNSLNFSLEFHDPQQNIIKFVLLRSKINFNLMRKGDVAGELIDIALPHKNDNEMAKLDTTVKFNRFIKDNVYSEYNEKFGFEYYVINLNYIIHDLFRILYEQFYLPWYNEKASKRIARLIYFIFVKFLNDNKISEYNYKLIRNEYSVFIKQMTLPMYENRRNRNVYLQSIVDANKNVLIKTRKENEMAEYMNYLVSIVDYSEAIIRICTVLINFMGGLTYLDKDKLYDLDIV